MDISNFYGIGPPPRKLILNNRNNQERFPITGDSWLDTSTDITYIFQINKWIQLPNVYNYSDLSNTYNNISDAVVTIIGYNGTGSSEVDDTELIVGSGFFISVDGYIVSSASIILNTNVPLVNDKPPLSTAVYVTILPEKIQLPVDIIGINRKADICLLKLDVSGNSLSDRVFLNFDNSHNSSYGEFVLAIGTVNSGGVENRNGVVDDTSSINNILYKTPTLGIIRDYKWHDQTQHRESVVFDNQIPFFMNGGPLINLDGKVIGVISWAEDIKDSSSDTFFATKGAISSYLVEPIINYFLSFPTGTTGIEYPTGFLGITYDYYIYENKKQNEILEDNSYYFLEGAQIKNDALNIDTFEPFIININNNTPLVFNENIYVKTNNTTPFPGSPAKVLGLAIDDIIIEAKNSNDSEYIKIGNSNDRFPLDTIIHLAKATGSIDIKYARKADDWAIITEATGIGLTGLPNIFDNSLNRFS